MKAWKISSDEQYDGVCEIVFADTRGKAKGQAWGSDFFCGIDFHNIDAHRAPKFDGRESDPPALRELVLEHGWSTECGNCGRRVGSDDGPTWSGDCVIECNECRRA